MNLFSVKQQTSKQLVPTDLNQLTKPEIELVLRLLSTTQFPVRDIEILYTLLLKLQEQFKQHDKNESNA
jgi:hypothetical protein